VIMKSAVTNNVSSSLILSTLKIEATHYAEMSVLKSPHDARKLHSSVLSFEVPDP
jgi:hypothetical protein